MDTQLSALTIEQARKIERAGEHLLALVNEMMDLARIDAGKLEFSIAPVSVTTLCMPSLALMLGVVCGGQHRLEQAACRAAR